MGSLYSFALHLFRILSKPGAHLQTYFAVITSPEMTLSWILMQASSLQKVTDFFSPFWNLQSQNPITNYFIFILTSTQWFLMAAKVRKKTITSNHTDEQYCYVNTCHALCSLVESTLTAWLMLGYVRWSWTAWQLVSRTSLFVNKTEGESDYIGRPSRLRLLQVARHDICWRWTKCDVSEAPPKPLNHAGRSAGRPAACSLCCGAPAITPGKLWVTNAVLQKV